MLAAEHADDLGRALCEDLADPRHARFEVASNVLANISDNRPKQFGSEDDASSIGLRQALFLNLTINRIFVTRRRSKTAFTTFARLSHA